LAFVKVKWGGNVMKKEIEYVNQLKKFVVQVQTGFGRLDVRTREHLVRITKSKCPDKEERKLLEDLIIRAKEFIELERMVLEQKCSKEQIEKYFSYARWFSSIKMLLETFEVPLHQVSFTDLALKE
jgi:hypothetical protein